MYKIQRTDYGYKLEFGGFIQADEMSAWVDESKKALLGQGRAFGVFVDMRALKPLPVDAVEVMTNGQKCYKQAGMKRSVVVLANPLTTSQFKRLAKESGIYEWERYLDASSMPNWEKVGIDWLVSGTDPDA